MLQSNELNYSKEAIENKALFYNKVAIVYVEGPEDIPFWSEYFDEEYEIQQVNGCENLKQYIDLLVSGSTSFIVAIDRDYSDYLSKDTPNNPLIIKTYTHSIENDMYCPQNVNWMLKRITRTQKDFTPEIESWLSEWESKTKELLAYDIASQICCSGDRVCGKTCHKFLDSQKAVFKEDIINETIKNLSEKFDPELISSLLEKLCNGEKKLIQLIRGHFYASGMQTFIRHIVKRTSPQIKSYSNDALDALAVTCIRQCVPLCKSKEYLIGAVNSAKSLLTGSRAL